MTKSTSEKEKTDSTNKEAVKQDKDELEIPIHLPFPQRAIQSKKLVEKAQEKNILETFRKVEINIPLLDEIKQF